MARIALFFACLALAIILSAESHAQGKLSDVRILASAASINEILGSNIVEGPSSVKGTYSERKSADGAESAILQYVDFHDNKTAEMMLKMNLDGNKADLAQNKIITGIYETIAEFPKGGANASVMTGSGVNSAWKNLVRMQFALGSYLITFDTRGIPVGQVTPKLPAIFSLIKKNSGM